MPYKWLFLYIIAIASILDNRQARAGADTRITLAASLSTHPPDDNRSITGLSAKKGLQLFVDWANSAEAPAVFLNSSRVRFALKILEDNGSLDTMLQNYRSLILEPNTLLLGPVASDFSTAAAVNVTEPENRLLLAWNAAAESFYAGKKRAFSMSPSTKSFPQPALLEMRMVRAKTISLVSSNSPVHISACSSVPVLASDYEVNVTSFQWIPESSTVLTDDMKPNLTRTVDELIRINSDAVLLCTYPPGVKFIVDAMKERNYFPKMLIVNNLFSVNFDDYENRNYLCGLTQWDVSAKFPPDAYMGSGENLRRRYETAYGEPISSPGAHAFYSGVVYLESIRRAGSLDEDSLLFHLSRIDISTLKGRIAWTGEHAQLGTSLLVQYHDGKLVTAGPIQAATDRLIYPAPTWSERIPNTATYAHPVDYGMTALQIFGILSNMFFLVVLLKNRNEQVFRASSPVFLAMILLGSTILYAQPWTMIPDGITDVACHLRPWLLALGFGIMFGAMFAKSWRIWYLYSNSDVHVLKISDTQLSLAVGLIVAIECMICTLISALAQPRMTIISPDILRPVLNYSVCSVGTAWNVLIAILGASNLIIIIFGVYLTIRIRVIPSSFYNESKVMSIALYNVASFSIVIAVVYASGASDRFTLYGVCTAFQVIGTLITTGVLFVSKIFAMKADRRRRSDKGSSSSQAMTETPHTRHSSSASSADYTNLKRKYRALKNEVVELRQKLNALSQTPGGSGATQPFASNAVVSLMNLSLVSSSSSEDLTRPKSSSRPRPEKTRYEKPQFQSVAANKGSISPHLESIEES